MRIKIKRLHPDAKLPTRATDGSAAYDLYACHPEIDPQESARAVPTGVAMEIPDGYVGLVCPRSGLARDQDIIMPGSPGVIDSDYRGEVRAILRQYDARTGEVRRITGHHHQRIAQLLIVPCADIEWDEVDELTETERGTRGFGSTGV